MPRRFAYFITDGQGANQALGLYRQSYRPSALHPKPQAVLCVWALAESLAVDVLAVITWAHDPVAQRRSYEILAHEFL